MAFFKWNLSAWSVFVTGGITGGYVLYKDSMRTKHMIQKFTHGNILPPLDEIQHQEAYFCRPHLENELRHVLSSTCSQCYYLVRGDVGVGKSRLVLETVKRMCDETKRAGAPVYVSVAQGKTFSESLAKSVGFQFDEHINFSFYLDVLFRVCSIPSKEEDHRLLRTLDAFEKSASHYARTYKKPVVLVIDEADCLTAKSLLTMQQKAKFWADTNIAKVVFIINSTDTEQELQKQESLWSRVACPILVDDLCENDAFNFLMQSSLVGSASSPVGSMEIKDAKEIVSIAGGRLLHLIAFKHAFISGVSLRETGNKLIAKECEKFIHVSKEPAQWKAVQLLVTSPDKALLLGKLAEQTTHSAVHSLVKLNIVKLHRQKECLVVKFSSRVTEKAAVHVINAYK